MTHTDLKEAMEKATPGPWDGNNPVTFVLDSPLGTLADVTRFHQARANAAFIALARNRLPELLADYERMREALEGIDSFLSDEITTRFGGDATISEEKMGANSRIYSLLVVPRNIARAALKEKP